MADDLEGDESIEEWEKRTWERSSARLADPYIKSGYMEGVEEAKEKELQNGFDKGYVFATELTLKLGQFRAVLM